MIWLSETAHSKPGAVPRPYPSTAAQTEAPGLQHELLLRVQEVQLSNLS